MATVGGLIVVLVGMTIALVLTSSVLLPTIQAVANETNYTSPFGKPFESMFPILVLIFPVGIISLLFLNFFKGDENPKGVINPEEYSKKHRRNTAKRREEVR